MDRYSTKGRIRLFAALALCLLPLTVACAPETPETQLSWDVNDHLSSHRVAHTESRGGPHTYVYQDNDGGPATPPVPTPRPRYAANTPAPTYLPPPRNYSGASPAFAWPVSGSVISSFGSTQNGEKNDGINIATRMNTPIRAAAGGTVSYAGDQLKGYGNLVLIKHAGGYVTAYAHADRLLVNQGDYVAKGQVIGYAGQTGDVTSPQLHFEIRRDTMPVDPRSLLGNGAGA